MRYLIRAGAAAVASATLASAIQVNAQDASSLKQAASQIAFNLVSYYTGNQTGMIPGILNPPYYWWEAGAMFGSLINYWYYTGDTSYNDIVSQGLIFQAGPDHDFMPHNQTKNEGNDDQMFWAFAAMSAAEYNFPNPPAGTPGWLALAQGVFNSQTIRWDEEHCNGGLRWQIYIWNNGYNYKNSPANGGLMNLAARLYAYTGNSTYADWVMKEWNWMNEIGLITDVYNVFDGVPIAQDGSCPESGMDKVQWTYSSGMLINVAAVMANATTGSNSTTWGTRTLGFWKQAQGIFFDPQTKVMFESACEDLGNCNLDQLSKWYPPLWDGVKPYLAASAVAAGEQCDGGDNGVTCGFDWRKGSTWDGTSGIGQQLCALEVIQANLANGAKTPVTAKKGGTSQGNTSYGTSGDGGATGTTPPAPITAGDRAGASILTVVVLISAMTGVWWMII